MSLKFCISAEVDPDGDVRVDATASERMWPSLHARLLLAGGVPATSVFGTRTKGCSFLFYVPTTDRVDPSSDLDAFMRRLFLGFAPVEAV